MLSTTRRAGLIGSVAVLTVVLASLGAGRAAHAQQPITGEATPNIHHLANVPWEGGSDLAFWGKYSFAGDSSGADAGVHIIDIADPAHPKQVGLFKCAGSQNDVSVWGDLLFVSVDGRRAGPACGQGSAADSRTEGIRVVDVSDVSAPKQIDFIETPCGSHTHSLLPDVARGRVLLYIQSYPSAQNDVTADTGCNNDIQFLSSIVSVPLAAPTTGKVVASPQLDYGDVAGSIPFHGCHDVTFFIERDLAAAACLGETQMWDIADPLAPKILSRIPRNASNPITLSHSAAFSWDGNIVAVGDEAGGGAAPACAPPGLPVGAITFFDISDPANPIQKGRWSMPRLGGLVCTAHNFNVLPIRGRNILVGAFYSGGIAVLDFTDPSAPQEIGRSYHAGLPEETDPAQQASDVWSAYWYNGKIYANGIQRGFDVYSLDGADAAQAAGLKYMNPQTQEPLPAKVAPIQKKPPTKVLGKRSTRTLASTGVEDGVLPAAGLVALAGVIARRARRRLV